MPPLAMAAIRCSTSMGMPAAPPAPMPVSVLYPQNRQVSARVRVFTQWLAEIIAPAFGQTMPVR
jgi:DNA-binding transcriptional LysR family regulator